MSQVSDIFNGLLFNLKVDNAETISARRDEITKALNREFRDSDSSSSNRLMVGSYGRWTAIKGISDLDFLYILPNSVRDQYEQEGGAAAVLSRVRKAIQDRYPNTSVKVDRLVVVVQFTNFKFEVQPVFENDDGSFSYPDTYADAWKVTKPRAEIDAMKSESELTKGNLRKLCKLARAWKNKHAVELNGLLIDTLAYNFIRDDETYRAASTTIYDQLVRDFFLYLSEEEDHEFYAALGSRQRVRVKKKFQTKAKAAYELCLEAIAADGQKNAYQKWRAVFGNSVPATEVAKAAFGQRSFIDTEEFVEDHFAINICQRLSIDCTVTQDGFRPLSLRRLLADHGLLKPRKQLAFTIVETDVREPFDVRWKVLNRGDEAILRNNVRGQIVRPTHGRDRREATQFRGNHYVECYIIKDGVVVARDHIEVPISAD